VHFLVGSLSGAAVGYVRLATNAAHKNQCTVVFSCETGAKCMLHMLVTLCLLNADQTNSMFVRLSHSRLVQSGSSGAQLTLFGSIETKL
jgi:hypothetical protein